jgi:putative FmdB family regulatory protein
MTEADVPTYQYACTECGHRLEAVQTFTDEPLSVCPECQGRLRKLFSAVGVVFKGSGFYRNDSRAKETAPAAAKTDATSTPAKVDSTSSSTSTATPATTSSTSSSGSGSGKSTSTAASASSAA